MIACRGLLFLIERRFEVFMNGIRFKQIIQDAIIGGISEEKKETWTTATKHPKKECSELIFGNVKNHTKSQSKLTKALNATVLSVGETQHVDNKHRTERNKDFRISLKSVRILQLIRLKLMIHKKPFLKKRQKQILSKM